MARLTGIEPVTFGFGRQMLSDNLILFKSNNNV